MFLLVKNNIFFSCDLPTIPFLTIPTPIQVKDGEMGGEPTGMWDNGG